MSIKAVRGTKDLLPEDTERWLEAENVIRRVALRYGYREIRTPIFEPTELFLRSTGEGTEIVQKEMYTFPDKKGRSLTLRPEGTPSVVRACLEHGLLGRPKPLKFFYMGPMFRYERPGAGRARQFHQMGIELLGVDSATGDAEVIAVLTETLNELGIRYKPLLINSLGCGKDRPVYVEALREALAARVASACRDCQERFEKNPLRILDCKVDSCRALFEDVPTINDFLCDDCRQHFGEVTQQLEVLGHQRSKADELVVGVGVVTLHYLEQRQGLARHPERRTPCRVSSPCRPWPA